MSGWTCSCCGEQMRLCVYGRGYALYCPNSSREDHPRRKNIDDQDLLHQEWEAKSP